VAVLDPRRILILSPAGRIACTVLNIVPLPGLGAVIAGWRNPHTKLRRDGALQLALVLFGSWPLIVPGVAGLVWACFTAYHIQRDGRPGPAWSHPTGPPLDGQEASVRWWRRLPKPKKRPAKPRR
jgi:hypothetical protein